MRAGGRIPACYVPHAPLFDELGGTTYGDHWAGRRLDALRRVAEAEDRRVERRQVGRPGIDRRADDGLDRGDGWRLLAGRAPDFNGRLLEDASCSRRARRPPESFHVVAVEPARAGGL